jgi:RalA-binding protein 1
MGCAKALIAVALQVQVQVFLLVINQLIQVSSVSMSPFSSLIPRLGLGTGAESRTLTPDWLPASRTLSTSVSQPSLDSLDISVTPAVPCPPFHQHPSTKPLHIPKVDNRTGAESGSSTFQNSPPNGTYLSGSSAPSPLETTPTSSDQSGPQSLTQPQTASRESRTTHPDEARQHRSSPIHFLADSPRAAGLSQGHSRGLSPAPSNARNVPDARDSTTTTDKSDGEFLDLDDSDSLYDSTADYGLTSPSSQNGRNPPDDIHGPRVAVLPPAADDFPLPPGVMNPSNPSNDESHLGTPQVFPAIEKARRIDGPESPTTPTPNKSTYQSVIPEQELMKFRALPLLPHDLPYTRITVTTSSIRPNDRGKDVLSFVVQVNPGNQKEPYMIEKLYSDVLGLDQRIRSRFGKSYKKIPHLPDGRLWKDHAPSRVDQRKVGPSSFPHARKLTPTI